MTALIRSAAVVGLGLLVLVLQSVIVGFLPISMVAPNLLLPIVIFLGVSSDVHLVRGAAIAFVLGYLQDLFCGNLMSLHTFILVATFMVSRGAGLRFVLRGPLFQMLLTFVVALMAGGAAVALRAIFDRGAPFPADNALMTTIVVVGSSFISALGAPLIFLAVRRAESLALKRKEESAT